MPLNRARVRTALQNFDFPALFIEELGWDHHIQPLVAAVDGVSYRLDAVAEKRGMVAFVCQPASDGSIPNHTMRRKIENQVRRAAHEHIIIYLDQAQDRQRWQWVRREPGRPAAAREHLYHSGQPGDALIQKLDAISFSLDEEESLTITTVAGRARQAFDVDRVTKRFYDRFKAEHSTFLKFIKGIQGQGDREWYASLMLNRLMFVYFIQKKGFLDGDVGYLRNRLRTMQQQRGKNKFLSFYRHFLLRLFHEGLGQETRSHALDALLGRVPYLNGGLFDVHELEVEYSAIEIPDDAFEKLFDFFDAYQWHLDERPLRADNEINPDVLGYIFEKYINQREMGAYYTKEDITEYITKSAIVPRIFERTETTSGTAFGPDGAVWRLLREDPDRYIYAAVRHGVDLPLPQDIAQGLDNVKARGGWNRSCPGEFGLPTETWREHIARGGRCAQLRQALAAGEIASTEDMVALNLNLRQLAQDVLDSCEDPRLLHAFYEAIRGLTVLDPTCGSGAFLFAALNVLEPLYEACLERMQVLVEESADAPSGAVKKALEAFAETLADASAHPNRRYFILKSIILANLFGVDIMDEAVEICKLRLFLKLTAQLETIEDVEPLPDIDFNIRAGNTLVGFASLSEATRVIGSRFDFDNTLDAISKSAQLADEAFRRFRTMQTQPSTKSKELAKAKDVLRGRLAALDRTLDNYLAAEYGVKEADSAWEATHQPFHWFVNFYGVISTGGFDVVIGNPPYVEYRNVRGTYTVKNLTTLVCGDLYALVMERGLSLLATGGRLGMITPVSIVGTDGFAVLRDLLTANSSHTYIQSFAERPSKLFTGVEKRLAIWGLRKGSEAGRIFTSRYRRWLADEREHLFATGEFVEITGVRPLVGTSLPKIHSEHERDMLAKLGSGGRPLLTAMVRGTRHIVYYTRKVRYFVQFFLKVPRILDAKGTTVEPTELKTLTFGSEVARDVAVAALNSNLFFWFFSTYSDVRNVNRREIESFPVDLGRAEEKHGKVLSELATELMADFAKNSAMTAINYGRYGVLTIQVFRPRLSKPILDRIDSVLADLYGLSAEELEFVVNFDIKYRLGTDAAEDEEPASVG